LNQLHQNGFTNLNFCRTRQNREAGWAGLGQSTKPYVREPEYEICVLKPDVREPEHEISTYGWIDHLWRIIVRDPEDIISDDE
jgi:hypothetical protein